MPIKKKKSNQIKKRVMACMFNSGHLGSTSNLKQKEAIDSENQ